MHGRGTVLVETWKSHGVSVAGSDQIWIAVIGPDTPNLGELKDGRQLFQNQIAGTVASLLGIDYRNERPVGKILFSAIAREQTRRNRSAEGAHE